MIKTKQNKTTFFVSKQKTETRPNGLGQEKSTRKVGGGVFIVRKVHYVSKPQIFIKCSYVRFISFMFITLLS